MGHHHVSSDDHSSCAAAERAAAERAAADRDDAARWDAATTLQMTTGVTAFERTNRGRVAGLGGRGQTRAVASPAAGVALAAIHMGFNYLTPGPFSINVRNPTAGTYTSS